MDPAAVPDLAGTIDYKQVLLLVNIPAILALGVLSAFLHTTKSCPDSWALWGPIALGAVIGGVRAFDQGSGLSDGLTSMLVNAAAGPVAARLCAGKLKEWAGTDSP